MHLRRAMPLTLLAAALTLTGCASTGSTTGTPPAAAGTASAATDTPPPASPPSCSDQLTSWRDGGGQDALSAVGADLGTLGTAATTLSQDMSSGTLPAADAAALQQASASLQADTGTAQASLPPSCVPGLRRNVSAALTDYNRAAVEAGQAVTEADSGSLSVATSNLLAASNSMQAGTGKIGKATAAVNAFTG